MTLLVALAAAADALESNADELTRLDSVAGDGDLGRTAMRIAAAIKEVIAAGGEDPKVILANCGRQIARSAASSGGTLVATGFLASAEAVKGSPFVRQDLADGLNAAVIAIQNRGKAHPGDRTMIDALAPSAIAATAGIKTDSWVRYVGDIIEAAKAGADSTSTMVPRIGRARALPERAFGNPDGGAVLVSVALVAALQATADAIN